MGTETEGGQIKKRRQLHVPKAEVAEAARMFKAIHAQEDLQTFRTKAMDVVKGLREMKLTNAADLVKQRVSETLTYYIYPLNRWRQIRSNSPMERLTREIRQRARVMGAFPDEHSALMLVAARQRHAALTKWGCDVTC